VVSLVSYRSSFGFGLGRRCDRLRVLLVGTLQMFCVGFDLAQKSSKIGWTTPGYIFLIRYVISCVSLPIIWACQGFLHNDPAFLFILAIMPIGPPALVVVTLFQLVGGDQRQISRLITTMYAVAPVICFPIVGALFMFGTSK